MCRWFVLIAACLCRSANAATDLPLIHFSCWLAPEFPIYKEIETVYQAAFAQLGYQFQMSHRPGARSIFEAGAGITDGECLRAENQPQGPTDSPLIRVNVMIAHSDLAVWSNQQDLHINNIEELLAKPYRIGYLRSDKTTSELMTRHQIPNTISLTSNEIGLKMLSAGRIDLYIHISATIKLQLAQMQLTKPVYPAGVLLHVYGYPYLHPKYKDLAAPLAKALTKLVPKEGLSVP